ncbi:MAG: HlyD family efflux transporter periplasmic adaptor subunit [Nitrospina sp.]|jgi:membrane fusion protein, heavy metal efflux system|nr:HlyD family efflux transporter periplasmic adaptor subunit [Nitrospina sp.]MBT5633725.1 HlyD family efflux transporter periplasmic adaptor subunit [Nitrospina sp.]
MNGKVSFGAIAILVIGAVLGWGILNMEKLPTKQSPGEHGEEASQDESVPRGKHGGWLFVEKDFQVEVKIYEKGVPPQFRVYVMDAGGKPVNHNEVSLNIVLKRLDRVDTIGFKSSGEYLLGDKVVAEPHSFEMIVNAKLKGQDFKWELAQIEGRAEFSPETVKNAGLIFKKAGPAKLVTTIRLPGEIELNEEKVVHIVPRVDGVVKKVFKDLGDQVSTGEIIAILESRELAEMKINFLTASKKVDLALADFDRETRVFENTRSMLDLLEQDLDPEETYHQLKDLVIGQSRELLIPAHAKLRLAKSIHHREKGLLEKGISSESEYLLALQDYKSAEARYIALREKIAYDGEWSLRQKKKTLEMDQLNLETANQKLLALGLSQEEVDQLLDRNDQNFTQYELRASLNGTVIQKHLTIGEAVNKDDAIFLLADLSEVWVNFSIPQKELKKVKLGQKVILNEGEKSLKAKLSYLSSVMDEKTRTVTGRVVLPNKKRKLRPGGYVTVELILGERKVPIAVEPEAIQGIRDWSVVFVKYGSLLEARPLELGENDENRVEVLQGLKVGEEYVAINSYAVKAEIEKSGATHSH